MLEAHDVSVLDSSALDFNWRGLDSQLFEFVSQLLLLVLFYFLLLLQFHYLLVFPLNFLVHFVYLCPQLSILLQNERYHLY